MQDRWPLVARRAELAQLVGRARHAGQGTLVRGPAGVGKSRLVAEAASALAADGRRVVSTVATAAAARIPFAALLDLRPPDVDASGDWLSLHRAVADSLRPTSPTIVVDDGHLLDPASAALVLHLVRAGVAGVLTTVRDGEPVSPAVLATAADGSDAEVRLAPLDAAATAELVTAVLDGAVENQTLQTLWRLPGGNPLLLREILMAALDSGALEAVDGLWRLRGPLPVSPRLAELVHGRLTQADPSAEAALVHLAVGAPLRRDVLVEAVGPSSVAAAEATGLTAVDVTATGAGWIRFSHPLYGEVLARETPDADRRAIRRHLADVHLTLPGTMDDRLRAAVWLLDSGSSPPPALLAEAAARAHALADNDAAVRLSQAAIRTGAGPEAVLTAGSAHYQAGRYEEAAALLAAHEDSISGSDPELGRRWLALHFRALSWGLWQPDAARRLLERAADVTDQRGGQLVTALRAHLAAMEGDIGTAHRLAVPLAADEDADPWARLHAVFPAGHSLGVMGRTTSATALLGQLSAVAADHASDLPPALNWVTTSLFYNATIAGDLPFLEGAAGMLHAQGVATADPVVTGLGALLLGRVAMDRAHLVTAVPWLRESAAALDEHDPDSTRPLALAFLATALALHGDVDGASDARARAGEAVRGGPILILPFLLPADVWLAAATGRRAAAVDVALAGADQLRGQPVFELYMLYFALRLGAPPGDVVPRLIELADGMESPRALLAVEEGAASLAGDGPALVSVAQRWADFGMDDGTAHAAARAARLFRDAGRHGSAGRATAVARAALDRCVGLGADARPDLDSSELARLTRREREVVELAARGRTNRAIAAELGITVRTAEWHLAHAFTKLGVHTRGALADQLGR